MPLEISTGNKPQPTFRNSDYPELVEALDTMTNDSWIDFPLAEDQSEHTIRNLTYRYTKQFWTDHRARVVVKHLETHTHVYIHKRPLS